MLQNERRDARPLPLVAPFLTLLSLIGLATSVTAMPRDAGERADPTFTTPPGATREEGVDALGVQLLSQIPLTEIIGDDVIDIHPAWVNDIWGYVSPSGREYALLGCSDRTVVVDITDPTAPVQLRAFFHPAQIWSDIAVCGEYAYVVTDGSGVGMQIIDLSLVDEGFVTMPAVYEGGTLRFSTAHNIYANEESKTVYLAGSGDTGFRSFAGLDVSDPLRPQVGVRWSTHEVHDVYVTTYPEGSDYAGQEIAFLFGGDEGLAIIDVTDPSNPIPLAERVEYENLRYCHQGWLSEDRRYLFTNDELDELQDGDVTTTTTYVWDVQDLSNPEMVHTFTSGRTSTDHNLMVRDQFVFEANYSSGLQVFDVSDPLAPEHVGWYDTYPSHDGAGFDGAWGVFAGYPSGVVVVSDGAGGLFVFDPFVATVPAFEVAETPALEGTSETLGVAWGDYDGDGDPDAYVTHRDRACQLLRNDDGMLVDATDDGETGITGDVRQGLWFDPDGDGDQDLYVVVSAGANRYFENEAGVLTEVLDPGILANPGNGRSAAATDADLDGDLDLYLANWGQPNRFFVNGGDGTWTEQAEDVGLDDEGRSAAVVWCDYDGDGDPDLAVANANAPDRIFRNDGGVFVDVMPATVAEGQTFGAGWADYDLDGDFDLYLARYEEPDVFLRNDGGDTFVDVIGETGIYPEFGTNPIFSVAWTDHDLDGWPDLLLTDGEIGVIVFVNRGDGTFRARPVTTGGSATSVAVADFDGSGAPDLLVVDALGGANRLYRNLRDDRSWLEVSLAGGGKNLRGIGARVTVETAGRVQTREIPCGSGYQAQDVDAALFGLASAGKVDRLEVFWPTGRRLVLEDVDVDQHLVVSYDEATPIDPIDEGGPGALAPSASRLHPARPNPFNPRTRLQLDLAAAGPVTVTVVDAAGRTVRSLVDEHLADGRYEVTWDGTGDDGRAVPSGVYFVRMEGPGATTSQKLTLLK